VASYTSLDKVDVPFVEDQYGLHDVVLEPVKGGAANSSFKAVADGSSYVLTVLDNHDYASALELAERTKVLFDAGFPTTAIVTARDGSLVTLMGERPVLLKRWVHGRVLDGLPEDQLRVAGAHLATLHNLPRDLIELPAKTRRLSSEQRELILGFADRVFAGWLDEQLAKVTAAESHTTRPLALCHGDLFADNLVVSDDGSITVLDWETISLDDPLLDLGMAALGLAREGGLLSIDRLRTLVSGYAEVRPGIRADLDQLPTEIVHAALIIAFHRYYRHNVRFPDPTKSTIHRELIAFVGSVPQTLTFGLD
jgi:homoserine kinase type II